MPRYHFHVCNGSGFLHDEEGADLPHIEAARASASEAVPSMVSEETKQGRVDLRGRILIVDEAGETQLILPSSEVIEACTAPPPLEPVGISR